MEGIWKGTADFVDPYLQGLTLRPQKSVLSARAPATTNTYHRAFKRWRDFAVSNLKGNYLPANLIHVAVYLEHVLESTIPIVLFIVGPQDSGDGLSYR